MQRIAHNIAAMFRIALHELPIELIDPLKKRSLRRWNRIQNAIFITRHGQPLFRKMQACHRESTIAHHKCFIIRAAPLIEYPDHVSPLARQLRATDYFTLGWGTMVGVGWLVIMDDWLLRGGALGALLGFVIGGALLLPIGWVYGKLVIAMPDAAGEIAYTSAVFPRSVSLATGLMMHLAYFIVCHCEAVDFVLSAGD